MSKYHYLWEYKSWNMPPWQKSPNESRGCIIIGVKFFVLPEKGWIEGSHMIAKVDHIWFEWEGAQNPVLWRRGKWGS